MSVRLVIISGRPVNLSGRPVMMSGRPVIMSGRPVIMSSRPGMMSSCPVMMSGRHVSPKFIPKCIEPFKSRIPPQKLMCILERLNQRTMNPANIKTSTVFFQLGGTSLNTFADYHIPYQDTHICSHASTRY